ncbi:uncharacterized protein LOC105841066 [Monomorium pharaonis]|uniref:uncharacterized protein LOC105841066 n=1 Tax=Monomorium pharaonis TaxID=307658 RepID=UPI00063FAB40|nr:uncharacterized protein LOC105841066 [Monomorium pharaonis]
MLSRSSAITSLCKTYNIFYYFKGRCQMIYFMLWSLKSGLLQFHRLGYSPIVWWPKEDTITLAISKKRKPENSWNKTKYQYLIGPFDTYIEAWRIEKKAICISTDDDTDALLNKFSSDESKRKRKPNKQDDFLYASENVLKKFPNTTVRELEILFQEWLRRGGDQIRSIQKSASRP